MRTAASLRLSVHAEEWATRIPFRITGLSRDAFKVVAVELSDGEHVGRGEGLPVHYLGETVDSLCRQIEAFSSSVNDQLDRQSLLKLMPPGGARR